MTIASKLITDSSSLKIEKSSSWWRRHKNDAQVKDKPLTRSPGGSSRDRYVDSLRVVALIRVFTFHILGWAWLPLVFPSMNIMFALAGGLMAASLDRSLHNFWPVLRKRMKRLLPPLWALGAVLVPIMLIAGWDASDMRFRDFVYWLIPVFTPPSSEFGQDWVIPLWYIRTYMWLMLLSPALLWLFRRWKMATFLAPLVLLAVVQSGFYTMSSQLDDLILSLAIFGSSWILGFAHKDNLIRTMSLAKILPFAGLMIGLGLWYGFTHDMTIHGEISIDDVPVANALYGLGFTLILLRFYPDFSWMRSIKPLDNFVEAVNSRAMTIYLWGNFAIFLAVPILDHTPILVNYFNETWTGVVLQYSMSWLVLIAAVAAFGWVEDLAANRYPRLIPWRKAKVVRSPKRRKSLLSTAADKIDL